MTNSVMLPLMVEPVPEAVALADLAASQVLILAAMIYLEISLEECLEAVEAELPETVL